MFGFLSEYFGDVKYIDESERETEEPLFDFKGFVGYFTKFFETRKNFYKDDGKSGRIATRIVDQNLRRFSENRMHIEFIDPHHSFSE